MGAMQTMRAGGKADWVVSRPGESLPACRRNGSVVGVGPSVKLLLGLQSSRVLWPAWVYSMACC